MRDTEEVLVKDREGDSEGEDVLAQMARITREKFADVLVAKVSALVTSPRAGA